jgi:hypothetical protein
MNGESITNKETISEEFNLFFTNIGPKLAERLQSEVDPLKNMPMPNCFSMFLTPVTMQEILKVTKNLKPKAAPGWDNIPTNVLIAVIDVICNPLVTIINRCFIEGIFPKELKVAKTIPIYKAKEHNKFDNYRPISLLCSLSKIFERLIHARLYNFFKSFNLFYEHQYGFLPKHSTEEAVHHLHNAIVDNIENQLCTIGVFIDLSKAFDTIDHNLLLKKLKIYGVRGNALKLLESYINDRYQFVSYDNVESHSMSLSVGVPQGSILGPLLYLIYTNDFYRCLKTAHSIQYADDTTLLIKGNSIEDLNLSTNQELNNINDWFKSNKLSLNANKTYAVLFRTPQSKVSESDVRLSINGNPVTITGHTKFLGVYIDQYLTYEQHINYISGKISKTVGVMNRIKNIIDKKSLKLIYYSLIFPYLTYCNIEWCLNYKNRLNRLTVLQKKAIRIINKESYKAHTGILFKNNKILKLEDLPTYLIGIYMFKIRNCLTLPKFDVFKINHRNPSLYYIPNVRTNYGKNTLLYQGPKIWNAVETTIKLSKSVYIFKNSIKSKLLSIYQ